MLDTKTFDASGVAVLWNVVQLLNRSPLSHVCEGHTQAATVINQNPEFSSLPVRTSGSSHRKNINDEPLFNERQQMLVLLYQ